MSAALDWSQPIERIDGVSMELVEGKPQPDADGDYTVREEHARTMIALSVDRYGRSWISDYKKQVVRNRQPATSAAAAVETVTVPRLTAADIKEARDAFNHDKSTEPSALFYAKRWGLLREETPAEKFTRETGIAVTAEIEAALAWASKPE